MGIQSFPIATPTPIQTTPVQGNSIAQMVNAANGIQAYKQAQQLNPLQLQQAQMAIEQAQQVNPLAIRQQQALTDLAEQILQPKISEQKSKTKQAETEAERSQFALDKSHFDVSTGVMTGLQSRLQKHIENNDSQSAIREAQEAENYLTKGFNIPKTAGGPMDQYIEKLKNKDLIGGYNFLENIKNGMASAQQQYEANLPSFERNAAGEIVKTQRSTGQVTPITAPGNINPTTPGVSNFGEYQKDLTNRVAAGTQIDMRLNEAEDLMSKVKTGAGTRAFANVAQKLQAIGASRALVDKAAGGDLSAIQSLNKFIAQSVTSSIGQMSGNPTANMMNDYLKNNPDVNSDPRALQRFIDFGHKQNEMAYEEQRFLTDKVKNKTLNPDTHPAEAQQYILDKFVKPKEQMQNQVRNQLKGQTEASKGHGKVTKTGTFNGKPVVQYEDGFVEYK
jgi:hypothetical protein